MNNDKENDDNKSIKEDLSSIVGDHLDADEITLVKVKMKPKEEQAPRFVIVKNHVTVEAPEKKEIVHVKEKVVNVVQKKADKDNTFEKILEKRVNENKATFKRNGITLL